MRPRPPLRLGILAAAFGVAPTMFIVYPLAHAAPVLSLGVVYLLIVLAVASLWGLWLGAATVRRYVHTDPGVGYRFAA